MKLLADQDVYAGTIRFLSSLGHDVVPVAQLGLAQAEDAELLRMAHEQGRLFVTRDRDFGALVFVQGTGPGVIYLRILPSTRNAVHAELERVLTLYDQQELQTSFVVVEPGRHRIRKLSPPAEFLQESDEDEDPDP
jgi:predicted nuclease of predicted toxin-antitoxin system